MAENTQVDGAAHKQNYKKRYKRSKAEQPGRIAGKFGMMKHRTYGNPFHKKPFVISTLVRAIDNTVFTQIDEVFSNK